MSQIVINLFFFFTFDHLVTLDDYVESTQVSFLLNLAAVFKELTLIFLFYLGDAPGVALPDTEKCPSCIKSA